MKTMIFYKNVKTNHILSLFEQIEDAVIVNAGNLIEAYRKFMNPDSGSNKLVIPIYFATGWSVQFDNVETETLVTFLGEGFTEQEIVQAKARIKNTININPIT